MSRLQLDSATRVFFVTDSFESNQEIFETLGEADHHFKTRLREEAGARLYVAMVNHAYREADGRWNYDDYSDTFRFLSEVTA
jgi:hypothetical protein